MSYTFTRHENPQSMASIMRTAWAIRRHTKAAMGDCMRAAWQIARELAGDRIPPEPKNLSQYLHKLGGLKPCSDLKLIGVPLMLLNRNGLALDYAARLATDDGFDIGDDPETLIDCIRDEISGTRHYAAGDYRHAIDAAIWQTHHEHIIDPNLADIPF